MKPHNSFVTLACVVVVLGLSLLILKRQIGQEEPTSNNTAQTTEQKTASPPNEKPFSFQIDNETEESGYLTDVKVCEDRCEQGLSALVSVAEIDDESHQRLLSNTDELANYLRESPDARAELTKIALSTTEGNKRDIILAAFSQLPVIQQKELGLALIESPLREQRREGVQFLSDPATMDQNLAESFSTMLENEFENDIKISLIKAFNQPHKFRGHEPIVNSLAYIMQTELDENVRGEALLAMANLAVDSDTAFDDSLAATQSGSNKYQVYGLRALELLLAQHEKKKTGFDWARTESLRGVLEEILDPAGNNGATSQMLTQANAIYEKYYQQEIAQ